MDSGRVVQSVATDVKKLCGSDRSSFRAEINFLLQKADKCWCTRARTHTHRTFMDAATCSRTESLEFIRQAPQQPTPK